MKLSALKPRFSIRTMLVLTMLVALFLAYNVNWMIRQRPQMIDLGFVTPALRGTLPRDVRRGLRTELPLIGLVSLPVVGRR